jgi:toxin ParE2
VWETLKRIKEFPLAWHPLGGSMRRCQMSHFPYGIIYEASDIEIIVIAVAHLHREPEYWRTRRTE